VAPFGEDDAWFVLPRAFRCLWIGRREGTACGWEGDADLKRGCPFGGRSGLETHAAGLPEARFVLLGAGQFTGSYAVFTLHG